MADHPQRREHDGQSVLLRYWPLVVALVLVTVWATTGVVTAYRADQANEAQWRTLGDIRDRLSRLEGRVN